MANSEFELFTLKEAAETVKQTPQPKVNQGTMDFQIQSLLASTVAALKTLE